MALRRYQSPSNSGESSEQGPSRRTSVHSASGGRDRDQSPLRAFIISTKFLPGELDSLVGLFEKNVAQWSKVGARGLELTSDLNSADIIVTAIRTRPRLERHISWEVAKTKTIVTPDWLRDSVSSGVLQPCAKYTIFINPRSGTASLHSEAKSATPAPQKSPPNYHGHFTDQEAGVKASDLAALNHLSQFSCQRASPLVCANQTLVEELDIIRRARYYEGEERSMLSYARAIAAIKAYPYRLDDKTPREDVVRIPYLGTKLTSMVEEFVRTGKIQEAQKIVSSTRFASMSVFNSIHGIGPHTARHLYTLGLRTIEDLEKYYEVFPGNTLENIALQPEMTSSKEIGVEKSIKVSLALRHEFSQKIPRQEVEEINQVITRELGLIEGGYRSIITGGYRRGKPESNDVDIVISHEDWDHGADKVRGLCKKLVQRLHERGLVTHVLNMSGYHPHNVFRTHHWDSLEKALTVFVLPDDSARTQIHRRVDLIFATPGVFWTSVVGWTGSTMFERDLRLWAKQAKGLKFDSSGITRRYDSKPFHPKSERDVFELLGLAYVHPTLRNTDV